MIVFSLTLEATLYAARNLKLPVYWNVSVAMVIEAPRNLDSRGASMMVVGLMTSRRDRCNLRGCSIVQEAEEIAANDTTQRDVRGDHGVGVRA